MIDKKELRSGNFVNVPHGDIQIDYLMKEGVHLIDGCGGTWQSLEPIHLSPEWLERFGFQCDAKDWYWKVTGKFSYIAHNPHGFYLSITDNNDESYSSNEFSEKLNIQYVHQLQNIYYSLTAEELELKQ